jgi:protease-4
VENQHNNMDIKGAKNNLEWERSVLEKVAMASVTEQRRSRRWGVFFKILMFVY